MKLQTIFFPNDDDPAVHSERRKMLANALQVIALGILAAAIIAPVFNPGLQPGFVTRFCGGLVAGGIELLALRLIGYISITNDTKEDS
jgi:hypothetical protein